MKANIYILSIILSFSACMYPEIPDTPDFPEEEEEGEVIDHLQLHIKNFTSDDILVDLSQNNHTCNLTGTGRSISGSSRNTGSFLLMSNSGAVEIETLKLDTFSQITFSFWIRSYAGRAELLLTKGPANTNEKQDRIEIANDKFFFGLTPDRDNAPIVSNELLSGEWTMLTIVGEEINRDNIHKGAKVYINGQDSIILQDSQISFFVDSDITKIFRNGNGEYDNLRVYNKALSQNEIFEIYTEEEGEFTKFLEPAVSSGLFAYHNFNSQNFSNSREEYHNEINSNVQYLTDSEVPYLNVFADFSQPLSGAEFNDVFLDKINAFSVSFWMRSGEIIERQPLFTRKGDNCVNGSCSIFIKEGEIFFGDTLFSLNYPDFQTDVLDENWHHVVISSDKINQESSNSGNVYLFIDGVEIEDAMITDSDLNFKNDTIFVIGKDGTEHFSGQLDNIRFYNRVLTLSEIVEIFSIESQ